jgi:hypothetical protein
MTWTNPCQCQPGRPPCAHCLSRVPQVAVLATPGPLPANVGRHLPCLYLGPVMEQGGCPCPARWLRHCDLHRVCTLEQCKTCPDYQEGY